MRLPGRAWRLTAVLLAALAACGGAELTTGPMIRDPGTLPPETTTTATEPPPPPTTVAEVPATTTTRAPRPTTTRAPTTTTAAAPVARATAVPAGPAASNSVEVYNGLGTWVDVYDWSHFKGSNPTVSATHVDRMADLGVQTLYLQTAKLETPDPISEPELLLPLIERAHQRGMKVVAWYLPGLMDVDEDVRRLVASAGLGVDGIAVDIESRAVGDVALRNARLIQLSKALRQALPGRVIGGIVLPPVVLEVVNQAYWPDFPYREIAPSYDVWLTMGYWTNRTAASGYRDAYTYTDENVRRLRNNLGQPAARVHAIGGIGDKTTPADLDGFRRAITDNAVVGGSVYDWNTTAADQWGRLAPLRF